MNNVTSLVCRFKSKKQIKKAIEEHGRFVQKKEKALKIEVFEITKIMVLQKYKVIYIELDKGKGGLYRLCEMEEQFEFLDKSPFYGELNDK